MWIKGTKILDPKYLDLSCIQDHKRLDFISQLENIIPRVQQQYVDNKGPNFVQYIKKCITWLQDTNHDPENFSKFKSYVAMLDSIRKTNFEKTFID